MFFFIPVGVDYQARRYPVVTFSLIGVNVLIFLAWMIPRLGGEHGYWYTTLWLVPSTNYWYTWITNMFVHAGFMHIIGNMVYLFLFGSPVEDQMGRWQFLTFYILGGLAANAGHVLCTPEHFDSDIPMGGASGAISACMGAFAILMFRSKVEFKWCAIFFYRLFSGEFFLPTWVVMSFWFLQDVFGAMLNYSFVRQSTAYGAHVGGFLAGMAMIALVKLGWRARMMKRYDVEPHEEPEEVQPVAFHRESAVIYLNDNGNQIGPITLSQARQMARLGTVGSDAVYWCDGMADWRSVSEILPHEKSGRK